MIDNCADDWRIAMTWQRMMQIGEKEPEQYVIFLAPTEAQGVLIFIRSFGSSRSRRVNLHLSRLESHQSILKAIRALNQSHEF